MIKFVYNFFSKNINVYIRIIKYNEKILRWLYKWLVWNLLFWIYWRVIKNNDGI